MSEYQYYEFQAIDRPLTDTQMADLRALSTRATITPTSFVNVYNYGDFRGDPDQLMDRYFDLNVYVANWGTQVLSMRLQQRLLSSQLAKTFGAGDCLVIRQHASSTILTFQSEAEADGWTEGGGWLGALAPLRADIAAGDLRALYLGWLTGAQLGSIEDDTLEPPVPPGLGDLSGSLTRLTEFLYLDPILIEVAADRSAPLRDTMVSDDDIEAWVRDLPEGEKDRLLLQLLQSPVPHVRTQIERTIRELRSADAPGSGSTPPSRTVEDLLNAAGARGATIEGWKE
jgi:hypothetical protein